MKPRIRWSVRSSRKKVLPPTGIDPFSANLPELANASSNPWGLALPALGMTQPAILVGPWHWIIRVIHLLMGLAALGLADRLGTRVLKSRAPSGRVARA